MIFKNTSLKNVWHIKGNSNVDSRGAFARLFDADKFRHFGIVDNFPQYSWSSTRKAGTIRGLHFQKPPLAETKLVTCVKGMIYDVVVDLRPASFTYLGWQAFTLSDEDISSIYIPEGFAHGYQTLTDDCVVLYQISTPYAPEAAFGVRYNDPALKISWPIAITEIAPKDCAWPSIKEAS